MGEAGAGLHYPDSPDGEDLFAMRRDLCRSLRRHRETAGLAQNEAADTLEWSRSKLLRVELGTTGVKVTDVQAMLRVYGVTGEGEIARLTAAARITWLRPGIARTRMPFAALMERVAALDGPVVPGELAERWEESPQRITDAVEALRVLAGERTCITLKRRPPGDARARMLAAGLPPEFADEVLREDEP